MELPSEVFGSVAVIHAPKDVNDDTAEFIERQFGMCEQTQIVFDLDAAETLDSVGLEMLLSTHELLRGREGALKLVSSNPVNRKILEVTRLDHDFEVYDSVLDAVKSFA